MEMGVTSTVIFTDWWTVSVVTLLRFWDCNGHVVNAQLVLTLVLECELTTLQKALLLLT